MGNVFVIIIDGLATVLLFVFLVAVILIIGGWIYSLLCEFYKINQPVLNEFFYNCFLALGISIYILGCLYQVYFIGFENTERIKNVPSFIIQFHCRFPYNKEHHEYINSIYSAIDYCN